MSPDWQMRGGTTQQFVRLPPMDQNTEHEFELIEVQIKENVPDIYNPGKVVTKVMTVWKEANKVQDFHKIYAEFNEYYTERASLMKFLCKVSGKPFVPGLPVKLGEWLNIGMRIKARVLAKYNRDTGEPTGNYKFAESIKPISSPQSTTDAKLESDIKILVFTKARGCKSFEETYQRLASELSAGQMAIFVSLDKRGEIKYPIP